MAETIIEKIEKGKIEEAFEMIRKKERESPSGVHNLREYYRKVILIK